MTNLGTLAKVLWVIPTLGLAQPSAAPREAPVRALVRRANGAGAVTVHVTLTGRLGRELTPGPGGGAMALKDGAGTVTAPATLALGPEPGAVTFRVGLTDPAIEVLVAELGLRERGTLVLESRPSEPYFA